MTLSLPPRVVWLTGPLCVLLLSSLAACGSGDRLVAVENPSPPADSTTPPPAGPSDSVVPPPDSNPSPPQTPPPPHEGIPYGPAQQPARTLGPDFTGTVYDAVPDSLLFTLEAARQAGVRLFLSLTGNEQYNRDENGFNLDIWKQRVDRFRGIDFTSYINDGTIIGHRVLDEPSDPSNWNGKVVTPAQIDEMAQYSKSIWPTMAAVIRAWPAYVKGYQFQYLDAVWAQYVARFGPIDAFIANNVRDAQAAHLGLIGGLNLLNGGSSTSGIPGRAKGKYGMSASEITSWGSTYLSEPYICAFMMFEYDANYLSQSDIKQALVQLTDKARSHPGKDCRP